MKHITLIPLLILALLLAVAPSIAQDQDEDTTSTIAYGEIVTGQINNTNPRMVYTFEGLRCDFLSIRLNATSGNLDPVLTILDDSGKAVFSGDDAGGTLNVNFEPLAIPRSGNYHIVVGRFGYRLGSTSGSYELLIERIGNGSAHGCALRYGDTVYNSITNMQSSVYYSFRAQQGDIVNVSMQQHTGNLDPYLTITDSAGFVLDFNDDAPGAAPDAEIQALLIPQDGTYYVIASRYGAEAGVTTGNFILTLQRMDESGMGNSPLAAIPIRINSSVEGAITADRYRHYYRLEARQNDVITVGMTRLSDSLDSYLSITNADLQELISNDDIVDGVERDSLIEDFLIPADGTYYIIATRFEGAAGRTAGRYRLELQGRGNAFDTVPVNIRRINYGVSLTGHIDDVTPQVLYAFWGVEGDTITVSMNRGDGNLDPVVSILADDRQTVLVSDDDSGDGQNARIDRFTIPTSGIYYLQAGRFAGEASQNTSGSYVLVLARRFD